MAEKGLDRGKNQVLGKARNGKKVFLDQGNEQKEFDTEPRSIGYERRKKKKRSTTATGRKEKREDFSVQSRVRTMMKAKSKNERTFQGG